MNTFEKVGVIAALLGVASLLFKFSKKDGATMAGPIGPYVLPMPEIQFLKANKFGIGRQGHSIKLIIIHTSENAEVEGGAHAVSSYFAMPSTVTSAGYTVDNKEIWQSVADEDTAWHAKPVNYDSIGIEHVTRANSSVEQWHDAYSQAELDISARLTASLCLKYGIPIRHLTVAELAAGESGIAGHADVNKAFHEGDHTDPGPNFPWDEYIAKVLSYAQQYVA